MRHSRLALVIAALAVAGCSDATGPLLLGRWAAQGIELQASSVTNLRMPCMTISPLPALRPAADGTFRLEGRAMPSWPMGASWALALAGQVRGDTIVADLSLRAGVQAPYTTHYVLVRGADPRLDQFGCLV